MPYIAIVIAALAVAFEQFVQGRYGVLGLVALVTLTVGVKARSGAISGVGAVVLVMLLAQSS